MRQNSIFHFLFGLALILFGFFGPAKAQQPALPEMVTVPAGAFMMGINESGMPREGPQHKVTFAKPFAIGKYEVTFAEWDACVAAGGCGGYHPNDQGWGRNRQPVINVSWNDAQSYVAWLGKVTGKTYRLPSEAEWEYAARAGTTTTFWWGSDIGLGKANCNGCNSRWDNRQTAPVGSFGPNAFGLYDMGGNVTQWVEDRWNPNFTGAPADGCAWETGDQRRRVYRSGSWYNPPALLRSSYRNAEQPALRNSKVGFRVAVGD